MICKGRAQISASRKIPQTIGVVSGNNSSLRVDGGTSSARKQGETFALAGSNLPAGRTVRRWAALNGTASSLGDMTADPQGRIQWEWTPGCGDAAGTYRLWLELPGGVKSNTIEETVQPATFCTDSWYVRAYNVDDVAAVFLNDASLVEVGFFGDSGYLDVTDAVRSSLARTRFSFKTYNNQEGYTWGYEIMRLPPGSGGMVPYWQDEQGTVGQWGANNNDQTRTFQWVYDQTIRLE